MTMTETETLTTPEGVVARNAARQAEALERLAEATETQNELLRQLVDVQAYGGSR